MATFVPNFVSFTASIVELAMEENNRVLNHSITQSPAYLMPSEPKLSLRNKFIRLEVTNAHVRNTSTSKRESQLPQR